MDQEVIAEILAGQRKQAAALEVQLLAVRASIAALEAEQPQQENGNKPVDLAPALNRAIMDQRIKDAAAAQ